MRQKGIVESIAITTVILVSTTILSIQFLKLEVAEHISTLFAFAVFIISLLTDGYVYGIVSAVIGVFAINYAFKFPYFAFDFIKPENIISAIIMLTIAILVGMLTTRLKEYEISKTVTERERMRANLLRAISHDIRTPLTTIYSASSTLREKRDVLTEDKQDEMLRSIQEDSEWLIRMVENLLSITRIDSGKIKIKKTPTILDELVDSVMSKFMARYPEKNVTLEIPDEIVVIPMDAILIEQVLINLLENSVLHGEGMTQIKFKVFTSGNKAVFEISDDGCGIPEDRIKDIFSGFYMAEQDNSDGNKRNAGIGLSVCDTIIKAHGGSIEAHNLKNGGASFVFVLEREAMTDGE